MRLPAGGRCRHHLILNCLMRLVLLRHSLPFLHFISLPKKLYLNTQNLLVITDEVISYRAHSSHC